MSYFDDDIKELDPADQALLRRVESLMGQGSAEQLATSAKLISEMKSTNKIKESAELLSNTIEKQNSLTIKSNKDLARSNDKSATAMKWLTGALVLISAIQVIVMIAKN